MLGKIYAWFWYHTEFWIANKLHRRPYTFIFRDWIYTHVHLFACLLIAWIVGFFVLNLYHPALTFVLTVLLSMLLAHLVWGSDWIQNQQEYPTYNPDKQ
jgi:hypothetical protein